MKTLNENMNGVIGVKNTSDVVFFGNEYLTCLIEFIGYRGACTGRSYDLVRFDPNNRARFITELVALAGVLVGEMIHNFRLNVEKNLDIEINI